MVLWLGFRAAGGGTLTWLASARAVVRDDRPLMTVPPRRRFAAALPSFLLLAFAGGFTGCSFDAQPLRARELNAGSGGSANGSAGIGVGGGSGNAGGGAGGSAGSGPEPEPGMDGSTPTPRDAGARDAGNDSG